MIIWEIFCICVAWFILYPIAKSLALIEFPFMAWWIDLLIMFWPFQIYKTEVATLFLILASAITSTMSWLVSESS